MRINADFSRPASLSPRPHDWATSPQPGVARVMLDRVGGEQARASSLVRYRPGSQFPPHRHPGGEEILVLSGVFSEEHGHHPAGCYLRNPPGSVHTPFSREGALIFVKLGQMDRSETQALRIDTRQTEVWRRDLRDAVSREICPLFRDLREQVSLQRLAPGDPPLVPQAAGRELLVLQGSLQAWGRRFESGS